MSIPVITKIQLDTSITPIFMRIKDEGLTWNRIEFLDPTLTVIGIFLGAVLIRYQLKIQHRNSIKQSEKEFKTKVDLDIYEKLADKISSAQEHISSASIKIWQIGENIEHYWRHLDSGIKDPTPGCPSTDAIIKLNYNAQEAYTALLFHLERYSLLLPKFEIFKLALNYHFRLHLNCFNKLLDMAMPFIPVPVRQEDQSKFPGRRFITMAKPDQATIDQIKLLGTEYLGCCHDFDGIISDLTLEAQNHLLGTIYVISNVRRKPLDPTVKVIRLDEPEYTRLKKFYEVELEKLTGYPVN